MAEPQSSVLSPSSICGLPLSSEPWLPAERSVRSASWDGVAGVGQCPGMECPLSLRRVMSPHVFLLGLLVTASVSLTRAGVVLTMLGVLGVGTYAFTRYGRNPRDASCRATDPLPRGSDR